jgi:hypothetical protein
VAQDYFTLKTHPNRVNIEGEIFLVFQDNKETYFPKERKGELLEFDEDPPF